jgi:replicative DNA helicase
LGAGPGAGKTTLAMQVCFEAVERDPNLKIVIANAETAFEGLLRRELTSMTGIKSHKLRFGPLDKSEQQTISKAVDEIRPRLSRMEILKECSHAGLQALRSEPPGGLVVDYLQKFSPPGDPRQGTNQVMATLRDLAKLGWWVLCLSATARTNGKGGSGHDSKQLTQASYRESGDIEFNADSCYLLIDNGAVDGEEFKRRVTLSHVKNRHGAKRDQDLIFNMPQQRFEDAFDFSELTTWGGQNPFGGVDDES